MSAQELIAIAQKRMLNNYRPAPVAMQRGQGCRLWDTTGKEYLDMTAGIAVCALGHGDEGLAKAIADQAGQLLHTSNLYLLETQVRYLEALSARAFDGRAFFCNSGAEANEAALKLARRYQTTVKDSPQRTGVVAFEHSFHGRTTFSLSVTGQPKYHAGFEPLIPGVRFARFGDIDSVRALAGSSTAAVIVEPIQAEGGIVVPPTGFLKDLRALCDEKGILLIFDEVQTGIGRTGTFYGFEQEDAVPDIVTLAKGIAGGVPMGAMLANEEAAKGFEPGTHASTFGGNALACAAALYVNDAIDRLGLLENCRSQGEHLAEKLDTLVDKHADVVERRGRGLLQGIEIGPDAKLQAPAVVGAARDQGLLLSVAGGTVVRFVPPLIVTAEQIDKAVAILDGVLSKGAA